jgi:hypothetical protein
VPEITSRIMELYFAAAEHLGDVHAVADHEDAMIAALDAPALASGCAMTLVPRPARCSGGVSMAPRSRISPPAPR